MPTLRLLLVACLLLFGVLTAPAGAQTPAPDDGAPVYVVTYFEIVPSAAGKATRLLRNFAAATRKAAGNVEFEALREISRPGRFAIVEAWRNKEALDGHNAAMKAFGDQLQANFASPFDARTFAPLVVGAAPRDTRNLPDALYVLTHVDVLPSGKDEVAAMVKQLVADSVKDNGAVRFDGLIQAGRPNHFHLVEAWSGRSEHDAHAIAEHTRAFRAKLVPFEGALYDERLFQAIR
ncbi:MAG TPA: antibiotic biosynthesis monooxygenase [Stellaceae bacterium]|jgi:quinol monooxygenase YgiN|nr:antibiotic biosynthesis monooxygenase [Stellaceae bacterium]